MQMFSSLFGGSGGTQQQTTQNTNTQTHYSPEQETFVKDAIQRATDAANQPFQKYDVNKMFAPFSPDQQTAQQNVRDLQGSYQPLFNAGQGALNSVSGPGYNPLQNASPFLNAAANSINPWQAGSGAIGQSMYGWNTPGAAGSYMDPYTEGAINRANDLSVRGFSEKTMPALNSQFVKGQGQLGRSNYKDQANRATRDLSNEMSGNAQTMMDKSFWNAANMFQNDQNRMLQAGTAAGNLANQNMGALRDLATTTSGITQGAVNTATGLSNAYGTAAKDASGVNAQNTSMLMQSGKDQQAQAQLPLTAEYNQWMQQQARPFEIANFMKQFVQGLPVPTSSSGTQTSSVTGGSSSTPSVAGSVLGTMNAANSLFATPGTPGTATTPGTPGTGGLSNIWDWGKGAFSGGNPSFNPGLPASTGQTPNARRGGMIRRYAQGGQAFGPIVEPRGVLSRRHAAPRKYAVGGVVPVQRGVMSANRPPMPPMGMPPMAMPGGLPPGLGMPPMGALGGGMGMPPMPPMGGALGMMR